MERFTLDGTKKTPLVDDVMPASLFYGPYLPIAFSVVLYFVFDIKKEFAKLLFFLALYLLMTFTFDSIAYFLSPKQLNVYEVIKEMLKRIEKPR